MDGDQPELGVNLIVSQLHEAVQPVQHPNRVVLQDDVRQLHRPVVVVKYIRVYLEMPL